jgi:LAO/AO transport system ATPase
MLANATFNKVMTRSLEQLVREVRSASRYSARAAARLMSLMTNQPQRLAQLLAGSQDWPQPRLVLGVTGAPGSGKSTLTDHLAAEYRMLHPDTRIGIVAVDPSSPFTGGALLGDRVRMMRHATDPNVFIRSLASRGHLGGLALGAMGVVRVMGLIGCDIVIVETVGVGQSEIEIAQNADQVIVVLAPGQGDSIQMLKAGLLEAGSMFVVNKADRPEAAELHQQLITMLQRTRLAKLDLAHDPGEPMQCTGPPLIGRGLPIEHTAPPPIQLRLDAQSPTIFLCSSINHQGIRQLAGHLEELTSRNTLAWQARRKEQALSEIRLAVIESVTRRVKAALDRDREQLCLKQILNGGGSVEELVDRLIQHAMTPTGACLE